MSRPVLDLSESPQVSCAGCERRFVGGTEASRIERWKAHLIPLAGGTGTCSGGLADHSKTWAPAS